MAHFPLSSQQLYLLINNAITFSTFLGFLSRQPCCPTVKSKNVLLDHEFWDVHDLGSDPRYNYSSNSNST